MSLLGLLHSPFSFTRHSLSEYLLGAVLSTGPTAGKWIQSVLRLVGSTGIHWITTIINRCKIEMGRLAPDERKDKHWRKAGNKPLEQKLVRSISGGICSTIWCLCLSYMKFVHFRNAGDYKIRKQFSKALTSIVVILLRFLHPCQLLLLFRKQHQSSPPWLSEQ